MNSKTLSVLVVVNALLLAALWLVGPSTSSATAQISLPGSSSASGPYVMFSGSAAGSSDTNIVYVVDMRTSRMAAVTFNSNYGSVTPISVRHIGEDMDKASGTSR